LSTPVISFEQSRQFNKLILDYVNHNPALAPFYGHKPDVASYEDVIAEKNYDNSFRAVLVESLREQYKTAGIALKNAKAVSAAIDSLLDPATFTVTTGHQLCLFTGPLYFIYKILTTITWCEELKKKYPQHHFVPVFWMASEDHDFAEVNHFYVNNEKIEWNIDSRQQPVGRLPINDFDAVASALLSKAENDFARKQLETFIGFYTSSGNLAEATRKLVHHLFGDKGLVILDADTPALKKLFIPYIKKDILEQSNFAHLQETSNELRRHYKTQVNGREINFFYLHKTGRKLIRQEKDRFFVEDTPLSFSRSEIEQDIAAHPENYSPNVIMRPLYQEAILPNLSYVGGPGEIAYWLQLKRVFDNNKISFPILTLRNFVMLVKEQHKNALQRLGLTIEDLFNEDIDTERKLVALNNDGGQKQLVNEFDEYLQKLADIALKTDNKIGSELIRYKVEWKKTLLKISTDLDRQQRGKVATNAIKAAGIKQAYFRNKTMQERFDNVLSYGVSRSVQDLITEIYPSLNSAHDGIKTITIRD
jgi:bacillithiol synthase